MLAGRAADIKRHKWFEALDWEALEARKVEPPRRPKDDSAKRLRELMVLLPTLHAQSIRFLSMLELSCCLLHALLMMAVSGHLVVCTQAGVVSAMLRQWRSWRPQISSLIASAPGVHACCCSFPGHCVVQDNEKKQKREPKETPEELQECEMVFADF